MGRAFEKRKHTIFARMDRVAKQFSKIGKDIAIAVKAGGSRHDGDSLELDLLDHRLLALEDGEGEKGEKQLIVRVAFTDFGTMQTALDARKIHPLSTASEYVPATTTELPEAQADDVLKMGAAREDDDDVQNVYTYLA